MPSAACHSGVVGGRISGNRMPVTKKPSFTSTRRTTANSTSHERPTTIVTTYSGRKYSAPCTVHATTLAGE